MRALTIRDQDDSRLSLEEVPEPSRQEDSILDETVALGVCGTDRKLAERAPKLPPGRDRLIVGHESLGQVLEAPPGSGFGQGDLVVGLVRYADPLPCFFRVSGEPDMCENGGFTERSISGRGGFRAERFRLEPENAVRIDRKLGIAGVLLEPTGIVSNGWERLDQLVRRPNRALVLGAGPIALLAALLGVKRGYEVHVMDRWDHGPKPDQVRSLGATYHTTTATLSKGFDAVLECAGALVGEAVRQTAPAGTTCLIGDEDLSVSLLEPSELAHDLVARNKTVVGTASSNRRHFEAAHKVLRETDPKWLTGLLGPCVTLEDWLYAFEGSADKIKAVIHFNAASAFVSRN